METVALILAKSDSTRLPNKNTLDFNGVPMYMVNLKKCLKIFKKTYVSSNSIEILEDAMKLGAIPIKRDKRLCGDTPNINVYKHALKHIDEEIIIAVQANSPNIQAQLIKNVKDLMKKGYNEIMTCHESYKIYGSIWALTRDRIKKYQDPYKPTPEMLIVDKSLDIHTKKDYNEAIKYD